MPSERVSRSSERVAPANGIELCYETFGSPDDEPMLLVMGLGAQMVMWPDEFCEQLAARGFHVIRYDNRDVGLSTKFTDAGMPNVGEAFAGNAEPPYTIADMAADGVGLLDHLGIDAAHLVGVSMGGMIVQQMAIDHPDRVRSLTSIMSHPGGEDAEPPTEEALGVLMVPRPESRDEVIELAVEARRVIGSTGFPLDEDRIRDIAARSYDRCYHPEGMMRQLTAIMSSPSRVEGLAKVRVPTTVIHGTVDPLVPPSNGRRCAEAVPGAEHVEITGMGHDLPEGAWPRIIEAIERNAAKVGA